MIKKERDFVSLSNVKVINMIRILDIRVKYHMVIVVNLRFTIYNMDKDNCILAYGNKSVYKIMCTYNCHLGLILAYH